MKLYNRAGLFLGLLLIVLGIQTGCKKNMLDQQPLSQLSETSFWNTEGDAMLALTGIYRQNNFTFNAYTNELLNLTSSTDDSNYKESGVGVVYSGYFKPSDNEVVGQIWNRAYATIFKANYFMANIAKVKMDADKKAKITAEVRFIRAYEYFYLSVMYGGVPLITNVLSIEEANAQKRQPLDEVVNFTLAELTAAATDLPSVRPDNEKGRVLKAAALAVKGRLLLINKKWPEAAAAFKAVMDLNVHTIDPRYKALFEEKGENSKEIILSTNCVAGLYGNANNQTNYHPQMYGGYQETNPYQTLIDAFLMKDGLPIEESPLYNPSKPFDNRDPRFYANFFLPEYTVFRGQLYLGHPDLTDDGIKTMNGATGYGFKKYVSEDFSGDSFSSGDDIIHIRYAEILLSYLEAILEGGGVINRDLLDQTINKVRARVEVNMPPITETDRTKLREIIRRERRIEFCFERLIRYMDIRRWGIFTEVMNQQFYGMKLTNDPANYKGFDVETSGKYKGHYKVINKTGSYLPGHALLPIPLYEININPQLTQNPNYN